jgi:hypothetical protein
MEPNNPKPNDPQKPIPPQDRPTYEDFHAEGIDIVTDSGISETNEFSMGETNSAAETTINELEKQEAQAPTIPQKPLTPEQATRISNLQEIPREIPVPKKPQPAPVAPQTPPQQTNPFVPVQNAPEKPKAPEVKNDPSIKQLRTFKSDAEEAVRYQNVSAMDIALAEQKKREASTPIEYVHDESSHARLGLFIIIVLAIIVALLGGWYYWFTTSQSGVQVVAPVSKDNIRPLISYKTGSSVVIDTREDAIDQIAARLEMPAGNSGVFALLPKSEPETTEGVPLESIFFDSEIPDGLLRSFSGEYMIGTYISAANNPFMILKSDSFPITFAGMLEWEKDMTEDLLPLIQVTHEDDAILGTTTRPFEDSVAQNVDVRVMRNASSTVILAYAFPNKDTVVITTSEDSLRYILGELLKVRTIQ